MYRQSEHCHVGFSFSTWLMNFEWHRGQTSKETCDCFIFFPTYLYNIDLSYKFFRMNSSVSYKKTGFFEVVVWEYYISLKYRCANKRCNYNANEWKKYSSINQCLIIFRRYLLVDIFYHSTSQNDMGNTI
jgi:hypothetical protein